MKIHVLYAALLAAATVVVAAAPAAASSIYQFRKPMMGLRPAVSAGPSYLGDGISTAGACAIGMTGCLTLNNLDLSQNMTMGSVFGVNNLSVSGPNGYGGSLRATTPGKSSGKWYFEATITAFNPLSTANGAGVIPAASAWKSTNTLAYMGGINFDIATPADQYMEIMNQDPNARLLWVNPANPLPTAGQVIGIAFDLENHTITFNSPIGKKGPYTLPAGTWIPAIQDKTGAMSMNFGQGTFHYPVPAGYNAGVW